MKAQGATEYIVLMSVVLGIALICVAILVWPTGSSKDVRRSQADISYGIGKIGYEELSKGIVAYYKFDEVPGQSANSVSGAGDATFYNGTSSTSGMRGKAASFDGTNDYAAIDGSFGGWSEATISAWVKSEGDTGNFQAVVSPSAGNFVHFQLYSGTGNIAVYTNAATIMIPVISPEPYSTWKHVAITIKSGDSKTYVNGVQVGSNSSTFSTITATSNLHIGNGYSDGRFFNGAIDDLHIYNRALSADEISLLYKNPGYP